MRFGVACEGLVVAHKVDRGPVLLSTVSLAKDCQFVTLQILRTSLLELFEPPSQRFRCMS
jgi:hypothetical protein